MCWGCLEESGALVLNLGHLCNYNTPSIARILWLNQRQLIHYVQNLTKHMLVLGLQNMLLVLKY